MTHTELIGCVQHDCEKCKAQASAIEALESERDSLAHQLNRQKQWKDAMRDKMQTLEAEVERLKSELSTTDILLEECKMDWSGDVTQIKAEHKHEIEALEAQLAAAQQAQPERAPSDLDLTSDEQQALIDLLVLDGHSSDDFEPECPSCTAWEKLTAAIKQGGQR